MPPLRQQHACKIDPRFGGIRIHFQRLLQLEPRLAPPLPVHQEQAQIAAGVGRGFVRAQGGAQVRLRLVEPSRAQQQPAKVVVRPGVIRLQAERLTPDADRSVRVALLAEFVGEVVQAVELRRRRVDPLQPAFGDVHELGNVDSPVGLGRVLDQHGGTVVALLVDVREKHLRVG